MEKNFYLRLRRWLYSSLLACGNRYKTGGIVYVSPLRFEDIFPLTKEENRRRNGLDYLKWVGDQKRKKVYFLSTYRKKETALMISREFPRARFEVYNLQGTGWNIEKLIFVQKYKSSGISFIKPAPEHKREFRLKVRNITKSRERPLWATIKAVNKICREYWGWWRGLYLTLEELRALDRFVYERIWDWYRSIKRGKRSALEGSKKYIFSFEKAAMLGYYALPQEEKQARKNRGPRCSRARIDLNDMPEIEKREKQEREAKEREEIISKVFGVKPETED